MPVGNASDGIGLFAGQIMISSNINFQHIDWSHDQTEGEAFDHFGHLNSTILLPSITIGLSDYWNVNYTQMIAVRTMSWGPEEVSNHHRDESSLDDFDNAKGGLLGDGKLKFQYLLHNTGMQAGNRTFIGFGLSIPSNNVLTSSPFFASGEEVEAHRHFALSDGNYKGLIELQYFKKTNYNPVFWGLKAEASIPLTDSDYDYRAGESYSLALTTLFKLNSKTPIQPIGISLGLFFLNTEQGYWGDSIDPSSKGTMLVPSIGSIWKFGKGGLSINLQKPQLIDGVGTGGNENTIKNDFDAIEITIGYRYILDYSIPWLYF